MPMLRKPRRVGSCNKSVDDGERVSIPTFLFESGVVVRGLLKFNGCFFVCFLKFQGQVSERFCTI